MIPNILAQRYASDAMRAIWSPEGKIRMEREYWLAVLNAQASLGIPVPAQAIADYQAVIDAIDLQAIDRRERVTRHDVKARIEAFNELAGHEQIHKGMTSRDLTENVEQLQLYRSCTLLHRKAIALLAAFARRAAEFSDCVISARTHNVAAQPSTMGKRIAMFGEETLLAVRAMGTLLQQFPARGLKGAVGTQLDQLTLFNGDSAAVERLEAAVLEFLGLPASLGCVGQVYPRSIDYACVAAFVQLAAGPSGFARTLRLMAGHELASEGFAKGQVGSSAMPHKMNARSCERINGFHTLLKGYLAMAAGLAGDQWNEGDVSCSVVRRVMLPDACFALDGLLETALTILQQMEVHHAVIEQENRRYFPFLCTTTLLMEAVKAGVGREAAHAAIKQHALATAADLRSGAASANDLAARLAADPRLALPADAIDRILNSGAALTGNASTQVRDFAASVEQLLADFPDAATILPQDIL
jgi:adenylosuccinate lyase